MIPPPILKGGQGRSERDVRESASVLTFLIVVAVCALALAAAVGGAS